MNRGKCKHFNGVQHPACDVGVVYDSLPGFPCIKIYGADGPRERVNEHCLDCCAKYEEPSAKELADYRAMVDADIAKMRTLTPLLTRIKREHKGRSWSGIEICPACGGKLHIAHAGCNGHMRGQCETPGCVAWIE